MADPLCFSADGRLSLLSGSMIKVSYHSTYFHSLPQSLDVSPGLSANIAGPIVGLPSGSFSFFIWRNIKVTEIQV